MPRTPRASVGGICYHVLNRGNGQQQVFHKDGDYQAFLKTVAHACVEIPMSVFAYCLMPNHFHLVVRPHADGDLSHWMHRLQNTHVRRYHQHYKGSGHVWQGRFKSFPIEADDHLLTVLRYVERNPVQAGLVQRAELWKWSSAPAWANPHEIPSYLEIGPVERPGDWLEWVNQLSTIREMEEVRQCMNRSRPYGRAEWVQQTAARLGLAATLRPRGRPRKGNGDPDQLRGK